VTEGQSVKKGQKIAEAGASGGGEVRLHFEIRNNGKPVNPLYKLPNR
jgi:murein DD-endopeptidase MepM/ murein hydrolase activator NlpD